VYRPEDFISGGYFLVRRIPRPADVSELLPSTLTTLSNCFTDIAPDDWTLSGYNYSDDERAEEAAKFAIPRRVVPGLVRLFSDALGTQHSNAFPNLEVAEAFYKDCSEKDQVMLVGIGLHQSLLESLYAQRNDDVNQGYGLLERVELQNPLAELGEPLGFELLGYSGTKFHSWLCHNAAVEASEKFGVHPNRHGFIDSLDDAIRIVQNLKATGAEPAIWEPWLVTKYAAIRSE